MPTNDQVGITPVVTRWNFLFHAFATYKGVGFDEWAQSGYDYSLGVFPLITLWNPYDRDLVLPKVGVEVEFNRFVNLYESENSTTLVTAQPLLAASNRWRAGSTNRWVLEFVIEGVTIPAGQAMNFSPPVHSYISFNDPSENVLVPGAGGSLINGFFTQPVAGVNAADFLTNSAKRSPWMHKFRRAQPVLSLQGGGNVDKGLHKQVVNLYDLSNRPDFDIDGANRFKSLTFDGMNGVVSATNSRVMRLNRAVTAIDAALADAPTSFAEVIQPVDSTSGATYELSSIDLEEFDSQNLNGKQTGISGILKFPEVPIAPTEMGIHLLRHFNPTSPTVGLQIQALEDYGDDLYILYTQGEFDNTGYGDTGANYITGADTEFSQVGFSNGFNGSDRMVLYELPPAAPLGIGQLMHANLMRLNENPSTGLPEISNGSHYTGTPYAFHGNIQQPYATPAYAIGNSIADPHIPLDQTKFAFTGYSNAAGAVAGAHYDYSYELNDLLWDGFYFSGIDVANPVFPLPNARLNRWQATTADADLVDEKKAAAHLLLDGGFNINSTSVAAWETILGALREIDTLGADPSDPDQLHNFARFSAPILESSASLPDVLKDKDAVDAVVAGFRNLTDAQISALATQIVAEIRLRSSTPDSNGDRYPFLSLSQFVNRSLDTTTPDFVYSGVLQSAIDKTGINGLSANGDGLWDVAYKADVPNYAESDLAVEQRPMLEGMAGFLTQADILNKIGPIIQARSDTFTIRSYGSAAASISGQGREGVAYYELVVQRTPAYVDAADLDSEPATTTLNQRFGRQYEIVSERWIQSNEI